MGMQIGDTRIGFPDLQHVLRSPLYLVLLGHHHSRYGHVGPGLHPAQREGKHREQGQTQPDNAHLHQGFRPVAHHLQHEQHAERHGGGEHAQQTGGTRITFPPSIAVRTPDQHHRQ